MIIILYLLAICIFLVLLILGFIFSKVEINIKQLEIKNIEKELKIKYKINVGIYLYGVLKILGLNIFEDRFEFLGRKITYSNIKKSNIYKKIYLSNLKNNIKISELKLIEPKIKKLDLKLDLGFENVLLTSFMIFAISTVLSFTIKKGVKKYNPAKYKYIIKPHYRCPNIVNLQANSIITINTVHIIHVLSNYKKRSVMKNERTSYRRSYEDSNEQYPGYGRC